VQWRVLIAAAVVARVAGAEPVDKPEAERLFEEGRALLADGHADEACAKFEASLAKDPRAVGTLLNLGLCNERAGKVATALRLFQEAYDRATEANMTEHRDAAREHIGQLRADVPVLAIKLAAPPAPDTKLLVDNAVLAITTTEIPLDPGAHEITVTAPNRLPWHAELHVNLRDRRTLLVRALAAPPVAQSSRRLYGKIALGAGAGMLASAGGLGAWALHTRDGAYNDPDGPGPALPHCGERPKVDGRDVCDPAGARAIDRAQLYGNTATAVGALGIASLLAGAWLYWRAPDVPVVPTTAPGQVGIAIVGEF